MTGGHCIRRGGEGRGRGGEDARVGGRRRRKRGEVKARRVGGGEDGKRLLAFCGAARLAVAEAEAVAAFELAGVEEDGVAGDEVGFLGVAGRVGETEGAIAQVGLDEGAVVDFTLGALGEEELDELLLAGRAY